METNRVEEKIICFHCGEECPSDDIAIEDKYFCCTGCRTVYEILNQKDMCDYYTYQNTPGSKPSKLHKSYEYLDDQNIVNKILNFQNDSAAYVSFYIPQIHCTSCIWILENLYRLDNAIFHSEVNFLSKTVSIKYHKQKTSLRRVVETLASIGYEPLLQLDALGEKKDIEQDKKILYKLGIAGFCFGNIMLLSFPEYLSIELTETFYRKLFGYLNFVLSLPVLFYSASDYFTSAFLSLKKKIININLPLSIGIAVLFSRSCWEIFTSTGAGYFDSMTGLVFLLLIGKYVQQRTYSTLNFERDYKSYFPLSVTRKDKNSERSVPVSELLKGERIIIRNSEIVPGDSIVISGTAYIDYGFITGESEIVEAGPGNYVYAGGRQHGSSVELEIVKEISQSYLTRLWNNPVFSKEKGKDFAHFTNVVSRHFTVGVILVSVISALFWLPDWYMAMNVFTAVLIVACPCALALSVPFTFGNAMRILGRNKLYLRNTLSIEDLSKTDTIVFDKTGTITEIDKSGIKYCGKELSDKEKRVIKGTANNSVHPLSRRIAEFITGEKDIKPIKYREIQGEGIEAEYENCTIKIGSAKFTDQEISDNPLNKTRVHISLNDKYAGYYEISNSYREGIFNTVSDLGQIYELYLLSGDKEGEKENLLNYFKDDSYLLFRQSPHDKLNFIKKLQNEGRKVLMTGDGLNDAGALSQSDFGISVTDDVSNFSPACDGILDSSSLNKLNSFLSFSRDSLKVIYLSFIISLLYNLGGLAFAVNGLLTPLIAAVLMPLSSLTIVAIAAAGTSIAAKKRGLTFQ
jgi:P-type Cu+ transporter